MEAWDTRVTRPLEAYQQGTESRICVLAPMQSNPYVEISPHLGTHLAAASWTALAGVGTHSSGEAA